MFSLLSNSGTIWGKEMYLFTELVVLCLKA